MITKVEKRNLSLQIRGDHLQCVDRQCKAKQKKELKTMTFKVQKSLNNYKIS